MVETTTYEQGKLRRSNKCPVCLCFTKELSDSIVANGEKSIVLPIKDDEGNLIGLNIDGTEHLMPEDQDTQNTHALDADGNLVITSPDGSESTTYVINKPDTLLGPYTDPDGDGIYTAEVLDADGNPTGDTVDSDFNALISSPHPEPIPDTFMSATVDPDTGDITLQYMNEDGPVAGFDPVVIPAPETFIASTDCKSGLDKTGNVVEFNQHHSYSEIQYHNQSTTVDIPYATLVPILEREAPCDGMYDFTVSVRADNDDAVDNLPLNRAIDVNIYINGNRTRVFTIERLGDHHTVAAGTYPLKQGDVIEAVMYQTADASPIPMYAPISFTFAMLSELVQ